MGWANIKREVPPRVIPLTKESEIAVDLHEFGDASIISNCVAVYLTAYQPTKIN